MQNCNLRNLAYVLRLPVAIPNSIPNFKLLIIHNYSCKSYIQVYPILKDMQSDILRSIVLEIGLQAKDFLHCSYDILSDIYLRMVPFISKYVIGIFSDEHP